VKCYLPDRRTVKIERRGDSRSFPALLPAQVGKVSDYYSVSLGTTQRIAGYECQEITLAPKDDLRYGYRLWADVHSGMLLKAQTVDRRGEPVEQFTFTQLTIGNVSRDQVRPTHAARNWRVEDAGAQLANLSEAGWSVDASLPGFSKLAEVKRRLRDSNSVGQLVYSDGMAAVSVFIEPLEGPRNAKQWGLSSAGAINIYTREVANHRVTVVGETPAVSVERIGEMVRYRPPR
jgi:sigma-E factor negative regulatory protein RseB